MLLQRVGFPHFYGWIISHYIYDILYININIKYNNYNVSYIDIIYSI